MTNYTRTLLLPTLLILLLVSCGVMDNRLYIVFENVDGLNTESAVTSNGLTIGTVEKLELFRDSKILATIRINKGVNIPKKSLFVITSPDFMASPRLTVIFDSTANTYYAHKDTVSGQLQNLLTRTRSDCPPDSVTIKHLHQFADTIAKAIREFGKSVARENAQQNK